MSLETAVVVSTGAAFLSLVTAVVVTLEQHLCHLKLLWWLHWSSTSVTCNCCGGYTGAALLSLETAVVVPLEQHFCHLKLLWWLLLSSTSVT